jgi:hypothetical protein
MFCLGTILCVLALSVNAQALTIDDSTSGAATYYGGTIKPNAGSYDDVIGLNNFNVDQMVVTRVGDDVSVVLSGLYFGTDYASGLSRYGNPGDLYISTSGWKVNNPTDHARNDTFESNEGWDYVISYSTGKIYELNFNGIVMSSNESGHWGGYRTGQAWRGGYGDLVEQATASLNTSAKTLTFNFSVDPNAYDVYSFGYHWTMACGNDVVEGGGTPVPEPATILLLGFGFAGLAVLRRKK